jgi:hypothetical protein
VNITLKAFEKDVKSPVFSRRMADEASVKTSRVIVKGVPYKIFEISYDEK